MYTLTVGLEVHAELKTATKMFCACKNDPDERTPNTNICPVCMAHPGTLPVINEEAVRKVLLVGTAVGARIADYTEFDRKNYFYPDIPKGYQISQFKYPLVSGGTLAGVDITRIHLEEDTARSQHEGERSLVDYNRAGVPLMELVTEPCIHTPQQAGAFARELQLLLRTLGVGEANLEKGEMRVEANISVSKDATLGTKVEVKNLNSFRSVERAIAYEMERHIAALEKGETLVQETRGWDENAQRTFSQRKKESSHDYRYFPDPDLPSFRVSEVPAFSTEALSAALPELPWVKRERYLSLGLKNDDAEMFLGSPEYGALFENSIAGLPTGDARIALSANYIANDLAAGGSTVSVETFKKLIALLADGKISSRVGKDLLARMVKDDIDPEVVAAEEGLFQQEDAGALEALAARIIAEHPGPAEEFKAGKASVLQFFLGQAMKETKGSANPATLKSVFEKLLS